MMILILAASLCLVITGTQAEFVNVDSMSPYHEGRQVDVGVLIKVGKKLALKLFINLLSAG